jgi:hypothetical protein
MLNRVEIFLPDLHDCTSGLPAGAQPYAAEKAQFCAIQDNRLRATRLRTPRTAGGDDGSVSDGTKPRGVTRWHAHGMPVESFRKSRRRLTSRAVSFAAEPLRPATFFSPTSLDNFMSVRRPPTRAGAWPPHSGAQTLLSVLHVPDSMCAQTEVPRPCHGAAGCGAMAGVTDCLHGQTKPAPESVV